MTANPENKTVLILGGSGLLGNHCHEILSRDYSVISTYNENKLPYPNTVHLNALGDVSSLRAILGKYRPDVIINTIALVTVDGCEANENMARHLNVEFVENLVDAMAKQALHDSHLIQISSDSVYGRQEGRDDLPWSEDDTLEPLSVYARTKLEGEHEAERHSGSVSILRTAFYGINPFSEKSLLWWIINNARLGNTMDGWENVFFSPISATSLVGVIKHFIDHQISGLFNVGSVDACNKYDFVDAVCTCLDLTPTINRVTNNDQDESLIRPEYSVLDSGRLAGVMPWGLRWRNNLNDYLRTVPIPPST